MPNAPKIDRAHVISWLSEPRYSKYLEVTRGDDDVALDLYLWNIGLAQAVLKDVSFFEVALRNVYDRAISSTWSGSDHWLLDDASPVRRPILRTNKRGQVNDANRLNRNSEKRPSRERDRGRHRLEPNAGLLGPHDGPQP